MASFVRFKRFSIFLWILSTAFGMIASDRCQAEEQKLYKAHGKRDPFVQLVAVGTKHSASGLLGVENVEEVQIEGIVIDQNPKASIAVLNGSVLKESDEVGNVKVLKIKPDGVLFSVGGVEGFKTLYQEEAKN